MVVKAELRRRVESIRADDVGGRRPIVTSLCDNTAAHAGGAYRATREATVETSTFCGNSVLTEDTTQPGGGAIAFSGQSLTVSRSTFSGNTSLRGGTITHSAGDLSLRSNTVVAPTIVQAGTLGTALRILETDAAAQLDLRNNLLRGTCSFANIGVQLDTSYANVESPGHGCRLDTAPLAAGNQLDVAQSALNLGPLADNGGPTPTYLPAAPSVLLDAGRARDCSLRDQRGFERADGNCDIGAVEATAVAPEPTIFVDGFEAP